ncbi:MAG: acyl-ACP--UDP-N-acetylglucosamine O-acyltransferase, partial [Planctomycetota bacterium]
VHPNAVLDENVSIGPFCIVEEGAFIGSGTKLLSHVSILGQVRIGHDNVIYPQCIIGAEPQDTSYKGAPTWVVIGDRNILREMVTIHRATQKEQGITRVGSDNFIMAGSHIAHDVFVGNNVTMANNTMLSGHVHVQDFAALSGMIGVHHFVTVGSYAFVGGLSRIVTDVPPYMLVEGNPAEVRCVNLVGLKRRGLKPDEIQHLTHAHRLLYRMKMGVSQARNMLENSGEMSAPVQRLFEFLDHQRLGRHGRGRERRRAA